MFLLLIDRFFYHILVDVAFRTTITAGRQATSWLFEGQKIISEEDLQLLKDVLNEIARKDLIRKIQQHFTTGKCQNMKLSVI